MEKLDNASIASAGAAFTGTGSQMLTIIGFVFVAGFVVFTFINGVEISKSIFRHFST